jgi:pantothenate kinase
MDGFHLANDVLVGLGSRDRKGAPDTFDDGGYANLLGRLRHQTSPTVYAPRFDRDLEEPIAGAIAVHAVVPLVVTEGNYLLLDRDAWPRVRQALDEVWHLRVSEGVRLERLVRRHVRHGKSPADADAWARGTDQRNAELIESCAGRADRVVYLDY